MKAQRLILVCLTLLTVLTVPAIANAAPPAPLRVPVELVDDATLGRITGKFYGADMLTGVRIDLVSTLSNGQGGTAMAGGSLHVRRTATGFEVSIDSRADASAGTTPMVGTGHTATGAEGLQVQGIGQITQIAGDGNRMGNLAIIRVGSDPAAPAGFNGQTQAQASSGDLTARVTFTDGGVQLGLTGIGATIRQDVTPGQSGNIVQMGQIAGNGFTAQNTLQLQMMTTAMPTLSMQHLGIQQVLAAISGLRR